MVESCWPESLTREPSAAQNVTVIQTCMQCGAVNGPEANECCFCDARLPHGEHVARSSSMRRDFAAKEDTFVRASLPPRIEGNLATAPARQEPLQQNEDWQTEVSSRLAAYRAKRRRLQDDSSQPALTFEKAEPAFEKAAVVLDKPAVVLEKPQVSPKKRRISFEETQVELTPTTPKEHAPAPEPAATLPERPAMLTESAQPTPAAPKPATRARSARPRNAERLDINISQPAFDFSAAEQQRATALSALLAKNIPPSHVAPLPKRRRAGLIDAALLLFAFGSFWSLFTALGGHVSISSFSAIVTVATMALLYAQYFTLFTYFGGSTPGMMLCKLRVVSFDGTDPTSEQLLWRSFGYVVSAGTGALGFIWALWDEEHLTWQDRISQTYLTQVMSDDVARDDAGKRDLTHDHPVAHRGHA